MASALSLFNIVLTFPLSDINLLGHLMRDAGVSNTDLTLGSLVCMVALFPAVLAKQVLTGDDEQERSPSPPARPDVRARKGIRTRPSSSSTFSAAPSPRWRS